jgi:FkbM family methyltransferase
MVDLNEKIVQTKPCRYGTMSFFSNDTIASRSLSEYGEWAQAEIDFLLSLIGARDTVLDVGAFIGTHTLAFARKASAGGKVYAFEPQPAFFEVLKKNVAENALLNVQIFNAAVSVQAGEIAIGDVSLDEVHNFGGNSILRATSGRNSDDGACSRVELMTIDQLSLQKCELVKIDVENMELEVLRGAQNTLRIARPVVFAECNSLEFGWPVVEFMKTQGYRTYLLNVPAFNPQNFRQNMENFIGDGREAGLVLVPEEQVSIFQSHFDRVRYPLLLPVSSLDDLALGLLKKPQYKYEILSKGAAAGVIGVDFWANEPEVERLLGALQQQAGKLAEQDKHTARLSNELEKVQKNAQRVIAEHERLAMAHEELVKALAKRFEEAGAAGGNRQSDPRP